jgi:hypothetical protein
VSRSATRIGVREKNGNPGAKIFNLTRFIMLYMKTPVLILILTILFISIAGCSDFTKSPTTTITPTPTPPPPPKYSIGDLVKIGSGEDTGKIILDYDLKNSKYKVRTVIFDEFGRVYYDKNQGEQTVPFTTIESSYPVKSGNIDNVYGISEISYTKPKFAVNSIHREEVDKNNGIIILSFDVLKDEYTYAYAYYEGGGTWNYDKEAKHTGNRATIEAQYKK